MPVTVPLVTTTSDSAKSVTPRPNVATTGKGDRLVGSSAVEVRNRAMPLMAISLPSAMVVIGRPRKAGVPDPFWRVPPLRLTSVASRSELESEAWIV